MRKGRALVAFATIVIVLTPMFGQACGARYSSDDSEKIARTFVEQEATFRFDGMPETLKLESTREVAPSVTWEFTFSYQSRHAGYGDRTGQVLAQVITPHLARITVDKGKVTMAVMDERWDMINQKLITNP